MNIRTAADTSIKTGREIQDLRTNMAMELSVDRALDVLPTAGILACAEIMRANGVPFHVSTRVLLHPEQRRRKLMS